MLESMGSLRRTNYCGELNINYVGNRVIVCGWARRQRDLGQLIFIDLRDCTGIVQLAFDGNTNKEAFNKAFNVRSEYVLIACGTVKERLSKNKDITTGDIEIAVEELRILSESETPPFEICENSKVNEELRLKYRYLDLRRSDVQNKILARHKILKVARDYFDNNNFTEVETPILIKSTPEGARDYLVPSRVFQGQFFALPQSPQLYKQLTMLAGFDRYMQVARCFRDEDLRADRQPEFTQIDFEMSFVQPEDVMKIAEGFVKEVYKRVLNIDIEVPFKKITYNEAMCNYGSDKPDLRFDMKIQDVSDEVRGTEFKVFKDILKNNGAIKGINAKGAASKLSRKEIDKLVELVKGYGVKGLAFTKINKDGSSSSSYEKFLTESEIKGLRKKLNCENDDVLLIIADNSIDLTLSALGSLRCELAKRLGVTDESKPNLLWVVDFPLFEYDAEEKRYIAKHHPFTSPRETDIDKLESLPGEVYAKAYDLILNGNEIGGGSIRISNVDLQNKMFRVLGFNEEEINKRFGFLINAFKYGVPPHGGMAFGLDRLIMIMLDCESIRDVIAFPKVASSAELMINSPGEVDDKQLGELGICLKSKKLC